MTINKLLYSKRKWVKNISFKMRGRCECFCLSGAVSKVYPLMVRESIMRRLANSIKTLHPRHGASYTSEPRETVVTFNDDRHTTFEQIKRVVRHAKV